MEKFASASTPNKTGPLTNDDDADAWDANGENNNYFPGATSSSSSSSSLAKSGVTSSAVLDYAVKVEREGGDKINEAASTKTNLSVNGEAKSGPSNATGGKDLKSLAKVVNQLTAMRSKELETQGENGLFSRGVNSCLFVRRPEG